MWFLQRNKALPPEILGSPALRGTAADEQRQQMEASMWKQEVRMEAKDEITMATTHRRISPPHRSSGRQMLLTPCPDAMAHRGDGTCHSHTVGSALARSSEHPLS